MSGKFLWLRGLFKVMMPAGWMLTVLSVEPFIVRNLIVGIAMMTPFTITMIIEDVNHG